MIKHFDREFKVDAGGYLTIQRFNVEEYRDMSVILNSFFKPEGNIKKYKVRLRIDVEEVTK